MSGGESWASPGWSGFAGKCPKCREGALFSGFLEPARECAICGLQFDLAEAGDGPAAFVTLIVGFLMATAAALTALLFAPPAWVHVVLWVPSSVLLAIYLIKKIKGVLIAQHLYREAHDGLASEFEDDDQPY